MSRLGEVDIREWGSYTVTSDTTLDDGERVLTKIITINEDKNISLQFHEHRNEVWTILEGEGIFIHNDTITRVFAGDTVYIYFLDWHSIKAINGKLVFHELQYGDIVNEEDIVRSTRDWDEAIKFTLNP